MMNRIYIHVPFCRAKCGYCAFYSIPSPSEDDISAYLGKLEKDFPKAAVIAGKIDSIFIGGGTPTCLQAMHLQKLFGLLSSHFNFSDSTEISIECNPETLTSEKADIIANFANRVSLGIQSFNPKFRKILGRQGSPRSIDRAIDLLMKRGISNIGCDLIYAIPGQTMEDWESELAKAIALPLKHISAYSLSIEEGTLISKKISNHEIKSMTDDRRPTTDDFSIRMWNLAGSFLKKHDFNRYEISNYSKQGFECRHNLQIWYGDGYLGFGPAASSFDGKNRWTNPADLGKWLKGAESELDEISGEKRAREIFVMGLRTTQGWNKIFFHRKTGLSTDSFSAELALLKQHKLITETDEKISCTKKGLLLWNEVAERLI